MKRILLAAAAAAALAVSAVASGAPAWAQDAAETSQSGVLLGIQTEGSPEAPVHVIEYVSLTCPHCSAFQAEVFPKLKKDFIDTGKITYEVREAYFDRFGLMAAIVARCGGADRYFGFLDLFLTRQSRWTHADDIPAELAQMGRQGGLTEDQVNACLADTDAQRALVGMYQDYRTDPRFTGTPTLIVGEEKVEDPSYDNLAEAIEAAM